MLSKEEKEFYAKRISEIIGTNTNAKTFNFNTVINAAAKKYYPTAIQGLLVDVFDRNESVAVNLEKIRSLKKKPGLSAYDIDELNKFESLLKASDEFWGASQETSSRCCARCQVMIADYAGGMFGGLGSVGFSVLVNYIQDTHHGGGCM